MANSFLKGLKHSVEQLVAMIFGAALGTFSFLGHVAATFCSASFKLGLVLIFALYFVFANVALGTIAYHVFLNQLDAKDQRFQQAVKNDEALANAYNTQASQVKYLLDEVGRLSAKPAPVKKHRRWWLLWLA